MSGAEKESAVSAEVQTWNFGDDVEILRRILDVGGVLAIPTESS